MTTQPSRTRRERSAGPILGVLLVLIGLSYFVTQVFAFDWLRISQFGPYVVSGIGVFLFVLALIAGAQRGETLVVFGSMLTMAGLVLLYQTRTDDWQSWAYAWTLVAPTSIGIGYLIYGPIKRRQDLTRRGIRMTIVGVLLFFVLMIVFEIVFYLPGWLSGFTNLVPALVLISIGVVILAGSWLRRQ
ncbi:MAG: hypothetical protein R2844_21870 [Caldilineales bacterium]